MLSSSLEGLSCDPLISAGRLSPLLALPHHQALTSVLFLCFFCGCHPHPPTPTHGSAVCGPQLLRFPVIQDHGPDTHQRPILGYVHLC